jgi:uncharacterized membrane protein
MNEGTVKKIVALGAVTGLRSTGGLATLAAGHGGLARPLMAAAAVGEMIADKTTFVGNRIDPLPLAGRAIMGGAVGALIAHEREEDALFGGLLGAATAVVAAYVAYHARTRLPLSTVASGLLEDGLLIALASRYA